MEKINKIIEEKGENAVIDIIIYLKESYKGHYLKDEELNNEFIVQLDRLYYGFCEDEDTAIYWSIDKLVNLVKDYDDKLVYAISKLKELAVHIY